MYTRTTNIYFPVQLIWFEFLLHHSWCTRLRSAHTPRHFHRSDRLDRLLLANWQWRLMVFDANELAHWTEFPACKIEQYLHVQCAMCNVHVSNDRCMSLLAERMDSNAWSPENTMAVWLPNKRDTLLPLALAARWLMQLCVFLNSIHYRIDAIQILFFCFRFSFRFVSFRSFRSFFYAFKTKFIASVLCCYIYRLCCTGHTTSSW